MLEESLKTAGSSLSSNNICLLDIDILLFRTLNRNLWKNYATAEVSKISAVFWQTYRLVNSKKKMHISVLIALPDLLLSKTSISMEFACCSGWVSKMSRDVDDVWTDALNKPVMFNFISRSRSTGGKCLKLIFGNISTLSWILFISILLYFYSVGKGPTIIPQQPEVPLWWQWEGKTPL